jgi:hypothetical protein
MSLEQPASACTSLASNLVALPSNAFSRSDITVLWAFSIISSSRQNYAPAPTPVLTWIAPSAASAVPPVTTSFTTAMVALCSDLKTEAQGVGGLGGSNHHQTNDKDDMKVCFLSREVDQ